MAKDVLDEIFVKKIKSKGRKIIMEMSKIHGKFHEIEVNTRKHFVYILIDGTPAYVLQFDEAHNLGELLIRKSTEKFT